MRRNLVVDAGVRKRLFILIVFFKCVESTVVPCTYTIEEEWDTGFLAKISIPIAERYNYGWVLYIKYDTPVVELDVFEAEIVDGHPNNKEYVYKNMEYNYVIYHYKDKILNLYLQGNQYPSGDRSVYTSPPDAEALFIPHLTPTESLQEALKRVDDLPEDQRRPKQITTSTTATSVTTTTLPPLSISSTITTTRLPWMGWRTQHINILASTSTTTSTAPTTELSKTPSNAKNFRHNLREVIKKSLLFYEAQRSGYLPVTNRIPWRSHSALRDGSDSGADFTGGYYTDGGHIKYGFPTAATITILSWGAIEFKRGYVAAKELGNLLAAIKWGTDYLLKCHVDSNIFYGQISDANTDNSAWGRPEDMQGVRPSYKITRSRPGSDLAAETAAAFAAASIALKNTNPTYSANLRNHSVSLFRFADRYRGKYDNTITEASSRYSSSGYFDELAWAAAWLYGITTETDYLDIASRRLSQIPGDRPTKYLNWDDKRIAVVALLAQMTNRTEYRLKLLDFCDSMLLGSGSNYTPKGLLFISQKDTTSLASNSAFICIFAANLGLRSSVYRTFAQQQLNYILGDAGRSYIVGYGKDSPKQPYHKSSSCPRSPQRCSWINRDVDASNPQELTGALVSGPDIWDNFANKRNSPSNKVSIYNNAGFQTLAAGILQIQVAMETFSDPEPGELMPVISPRFDKHQDYGQVLRYSDMFYEAQRSGRWPVNSRITWRKSACVNDKSLKGNDLSGGFFDGADYIKFNFPMAYSTTVLAWGMLMFPQSYVGAGEDSALRSILRWATDYFIKCHPEKYKLYGQVGSSALEHSHWLRPEDINYMRPAFAISKQYPGSELAAETAAAMAATASVFWSTDSKYSNLLVKHAKELYEFADQYRGAYHRSIADAAQFYPSYNGYKDELVWASIWLYLATNETSYLNEAKSKYTQFRLDASPPQDFYWDDKTAGINFLLARLTKGKTYKSEAKKFCDKMLYGSSYTPKGLLYRRPWAPLQYASGAALICLMTAELGESPTEYREFAKKQIHYILGDGGLGSYVGGYGPSPPKQPYHRASSCPPAPSPCNFTALYSKENNPHILYGAVVGGPDHKDQYIDDRANARTNKVTLAYNAAFQSAVAGLRYLEMFPPPTQPPVTRKPSKPKTRIKVRLPTTTSTTTKTTPTTSTIATTNAALIQAFSIATTGLHAAGTSNVFTTAPPNSTLSPAPTTVNDTNTLNTTYPNHAENATLVSFNATQTPQPRNTTIPLAFNDTTLAGKYHTTELSENIPARTTVTWYNNTTQAETNRTRAVEEARNSTKPWISNNTREKSRYCGRKRALELFDSCAIPAKGFDVHPDSKVYRCRYRAFEDCIGVQTDNCIDSVWEYWPYWNYNTNDSLFFGADDLNCKDQTTLDIETCQLIGLSHVFDDCYEKLEEWNGTFNEGECRWVVFGTCVSEVLDHCKRTWKIWKLWNMGLPPEQQFTEDEMDCPRSSAVRISSIQPKYFVLFCLPVFSCILFS